MNINAFFNSEQGRDLIQQISAKVGTSTSETKDVIATAVPKIINQLKNNTSSTEGAQGFLGALQTHDGSILDNLSGFITSSNLKDGNSILGKIFAGNQSAVEQEVSNKTGVSSSQVMNILALLAPVVMGYLGKQSKNSSSGGGITDMLSGVLDQDGNGKLELNDVISAVSGKGKKSSGLGGLLSGLFGKK